jgi:hypothetical protein
MQPMLPSAPAQPDCPFAEAATYVPGVFSARQQFAKQRHGLKLQAPFECTGRAMYAALHGEESNQIL